MGSFIGDVLLLPCTLKQDRGRDIYLKFCRDPEDRLTAYEALEHPWFRQQLGRDATSTLDAQEANNIVPLGTASPASRTAHQPAAAVGQPAMRR